MIIELDSVEFGIDDYITEFDDTNIDNSYEVLNYIGIIKLKKSDPRIQSIKNSNEFIIMVDKPKYLYSYHHPRRVKFEECCKCITVEGEEYLYIQINYNKVTVMGIMRERDYLIDNLLDK